VKFYSSWQPADPEDARTALVFGFMRHAPVAHALRPWLSDVLQRDINAESLEAEDFWPQFPSLFEGQQRTEPEIVFEGDDGRPLVLVIEAKPGYGQHTIDQVSREIVDTINGTNTLRLALIMIGADLGDPPEMDEWRTAVTTDLAARGIRNVQVELRYSSWARLGHHIQSCAEAEPSWSSYAHDVLTQLRLRELLGYNGGPVFDDLEGLTISTATTAFNRTVLAARQLFLAIVGQPRFSRLGIKPLGGKNFTILRDDGSSSLYAHEDYFQVSTLMIAGRRSTWPEGAGVFVAVWLGDEEAELNVGAFSATPLVNLAYGYGESDQVEPSELEIAALRDASDEVLPVLAATEEKDKEWRLARRPWRSGTPETDVDWAVNGIEAAVKIWESGS
jgi:hypothetical protein